MNFRRFGTFLGIALCLGCDSNGGKVIPAAATDSPVATDPLPQVTHPEYANWSQFGEQSFITKKRVVTNPHGSVIVTTKLWLDKKDAKQVSVASQVTVERQDQSSETNDVNIVSFPATYSLPPGMDEARFLLPSAKAKETGSELLRINGIEINAKIFEWEENNDTGPMTVKLWQSNDIPGKMVRQEMYTSSSETKTVEEVIDLSLDKP